MYYTKMCDFHLKKKKFESLPDTYNFIKYLYLKVRILMNLFSKEKWRQAEYIMFTLPT